MQPTSWRPERGRERGWAADLGRPPAPRRVPRRDSRVEANARLTATTGIALLVMLAAEGVTLLSIHRLLAWHVAIGIALIPPLSLKLASTFWRFAHYYLGDRSYRRAGPPVPLLRAIGPVIVVSTVALIASGVGLWVAGPQDHALLQLHQASFVIWFVVMTVHVLAHVLRAGRLASEDLVPARGDLVARSRRARQILVLLVVVVGIFVAVSFGGIGHAWTGFVHGSGIGTPSLHG